MEKLTLHNITLNAGTLIPAGTRGDGQFCNRTHGRPFMVVTPVGFASFRTMRFTTFFKRPRMVTLARWSFDGIAKTVTGKRCEPDGYGSDGSPSWLLALDMI